MLLRTIIGPVAVFVSSQIWAAAPFTPVCGSNTTSFRRGMAGLTEAMKKQLSEGKSVLKARGDLGKWPDIKRKKAERNMGEVFCPFGADQPEENDQIETRVAKDKNGKETVYRVAQGFIVGSERTLATSAHLFYRTDGTPRVPVERFGECEFHNFNGQSSFLKFSPGSYQFGDDPGKNENDDFAIVLLEKELPGAKGLPIDRSGEILANNNSFTIPTSMFMNRDCQKLSYQRAPFVNSPETLKLICHSIPGYSGAAVVRETPTGFIATGIVRGGYGPTFDPASNPLKAAAIGRRLIGIIDQVGGRPAQTASVSQ